MTGMIKFELNSDYDVDYVSNNELTKWFLILFCCSCVLELYTHIFWDADKEDEVEEEESSYEFWWMG
jgi:hypothetical protein